MSNLKIMDHQVFPCLPKRGLSITTSAKLKDNNKEDTNIVKNEHLKRLTSQVAMTVAFFESNKNINSFKDRLNNKIEEERTRSSVKNARENFENFTKRLENRNNLLRSPIIKSYSNNRQSLNLNTNNQDNCDSESSVSFSTPSSSSSSSYTASPRSISQYQEVSVNSLSFVNEIDKKPQKSATLKNTSSFLYQSKPSSNKLETFFETKVLNTEITRQSVQKVALDNHIQKINEKPRSCFVKRSETTVSCNFQNKKLNNNEICSVNKK